MWSGGDGVPVVGNVVSDNRSERFPGRARLRASAEFQAVFTACRRLSSPSLRLHAQPRFDAVEARLGVAVSKRVDKRAVGRNRLKRLVREYFRRHRHDLPAGDYVLIVKPEARQVSVTGLNHELAGLFAKAQTLKPQASTGTMPPFDPAPPAPSSAS